MARWSVVIWAAVTPDLEDEIELDFKEAGTALARLDPERIHVHAYRTFPDGSYQLDSGPRLDPDDAYRAEPGQALSLDQALSATPCWGPATAETSGVRRMLVLWGHGARAFPEGRSRANARDDEDARRRSLLLEVPDGASVARMFRAADAGPAPPDIIGYDACRMGTVATALELSSGTRASYLIASMMPEPASGWPYFQALQLLEGPWADDPRAVASGLVEAYAASVDVNDWCMLALDLSRMETLRASLRKLAASPPPAAIDFFTAAQGADIADDTNLADLGALMARLSAERGSPETEVRACLLDAIVTRRGAGSLAGRSGLAVLVGLPPAKGAPPWPERPGWTDYLPDAFPTS